MACQVHLFMSNGVDEDFFCLFATNSMADHTVVNHDDPTEAHMHESHNINVLCLESRSFLNRKHDYRI